ncbi:MAG: hypothetical protein GOVbin2937_10 [Prokaryotic dsDNA virus sp.]|nr:MAG: hypothetical protein GOVbin2937_10 [Prokaryotic dsDNA virus sp.]
MTETAPERIWATHSETWALLSWGNGLTQFAIKAEPNTSAPICWMMR